MPAKIFVDEIARAWEEEGLFARDLNGQLIRAEDATAKQYAQFVTMTIDGQSISVPRATPAVDSQGNIIFLDAAGRTQPRQTTILDARNALKNQEQQSATASDCEHFIPTVCHLAHLNPAGVCRVCSVAVAKQDANGRISVQDKLVPACLQPVQPGMMVYTLDCPADASTTDDSKAREVALAARNRVRTNVKTLVELLAADHLPGLRPATATGEASDLEQLLDKLQQKGLGIERTRLAPRRSQGSPKVNGHAPLANNASQRDTSSPLIVVDHQACILCDRCVRSCSDIKQNFVIGRTGKGYLTEIGFDLNEPMGESSCVECGECALACPTTALTIVKPPEEPAWWLEQVGGTNSATGKLFSGHPGKSAATPASLANHRYLGHLSYRQRQWFQYSVVRWELQPGDELCRKGEYGFTAFLLESGQFEGWRQDPRDAQSDATANPSASGGIWSYFGLSSATTKRTASVELGQPDFECGTEAIILGEMTLISHQARRATLRAKTSCVVYEIRRNVLYALQRHPHVREELDQVYRGRALRDVLQFVHQRAGRNLSHRLFGELGQEDLEACRRFLDQASRQPVSATNPKRQVDLIRVEPGQVICRQDELAEDFYIIRIGHVNVTQTIGGEERVIDYFRPNHSFGEIACVADWDELQTELSLKPDASRRTATCTALDDVELVRVDKQIFRQLLLQVPALRKIVLARAKQLKGFSPPATTPGARPTTNTPILREFTEQGLYNAQRLLVLDLEACTRCDECTKACSDTHDGVTRLIREGLRFDKWLVASSCRSCTDPYCLVGCPVDSIHRDGERLEIQIEDHCIGCGLCAKNCPYGNINMHEQSQGKATISHRASTCDLCHKIVGPNEDVSCVFACPHNAAFRMSGTELLAKIEGYRPV
ncbi:Anaerobic dimethyl sulfoxide reductase chain B [Anatilimnocola aggregata]|uniref:Anaerobic dimethyl sulfoxide reductase chain B n=1 Tax=Anatilimnocola aggregata TaxID=2528021 RepID=A0A517YEC8_9BACT|nr:cyclic nucleotide-binding domain-containing protein [Anatilimnocola aggregata]QDU28566.1 Anaerobic dimethyl sulfoxide reductase chain B [Anatilimnocola aggregata]